ncbi:thioesterase II family protein [Streptosporangium longisporum]|uniref:Thioesterase domain-containing protein n=1 Tax=Streptosporangium longisporum TaxID=46187 RepID=A0ABN3XRQ9_9ACTN
MTLWLEREPSPYAAGRVFCLPHAGCGTSVFGAWPQERNSTEFLPVELPGRLSRFDNPMPDTFQELADAMIDGLWPYLDVPFALFGHCWSAYAAYEVAVRLERTGRPPASLFVSSQLAPQDGPVGRMLTMSDAELRAELEESIREQGNTPHPELVAIYLKILRTDVEVSRRYLVPDPVRLACPITAIGWSEDTEVRPEEMKGWAECGDTAFLVLPGWHHRFQDAPDELLETLQAGSKRE